jgi:DNA helicase-2/ATP-dependent DNA helicase PcrA
MRVEAIYGPPGTGKTTELLRRVQHVRDSGVQSERIAFVSFTRAAASEALSRLGIKRSNNVSTIHAMAFRHLGLKQAQVVDSAKLREFSNIVGIPIIGKSPEDDEERADGDFYLDLLNYARSTFTPPAQAYDYSERPGTRSEFDLFVRSYSDWKRTYGYYDFTDMLDRAAQGGVRPDAEVLFVDEAQDLSPLQWAVIDKLCKKAHEVHIAGDDDQAIYTWSGADPHGMARFAQKHGGHSHVLSLSHRLPVAVHEKSQALIRRVVRRVDKKFNSKGHVGLVRVHGSINSVDIAHGEDTLLLGRTHSVLREVEQSFIEKRIPYVRESGRPGMFQNRFAIGLRAFRKIGRGERLADTERAALFNIATDETRRLMGNNDYGAIASKPFYVALNIPAQAVDFYADVDLDVEPTIRLSTIHAAKGHEADRVVLLTDMTTRVTQTAEKNPDDEIRVFYVGMTRSKHTLDIVEGYNGFKI